MTLTHSRIIPISQIQCLQSSDVM